tara:strand:+ start:4408 stop:5316 length:909 start_codon:yes stop_codon:yes gene_type:complete
MKKKILITGGAGFIGSNLTKYLVRKKLKVNVLDNLSNSKKPKPDKNIKFYFGDIRNKNNLIKASKDCGIIVHLAAKSALQETINNPDECVSNNILGTVNIIDTCIKKKIRLVFASTCAVYPFKSNKKFKEQDASNYLTPYSISKMTCENIINFYISQKKIKANILRFFNVYGKGQKPDSFYSAVVPKFIKQSKNNSNLTVYNSGNQKRDFINVIDVCEAIYKAMRYKKSNTFNIGTGVTTSIKDLANLIIKENKGGRIIKAKNTKFDALFSCANMYKTNSYLKFKSKIDIRTGVKKLIKNEI